MYATNVICFIYKDIFIELDQFMIYLKYVHSTSFYRSGIQQGPQTFSSYHIHFLNIKCKILNNINYNYNYNLNIINNNAPTKIANTVNTNLEGICFKHSTCDNFMYNNALKRSTLKLSAHFYW